MNDRPSGKAKDEQQPTAAVERTPLRRTCFAIMPISDHPNYPVAHFGEVYEYLIKPAAEEAGFSCERADTTSASHMIHVEIISKVHGADLCICDLSTRNPNVLYELGIRQAFDRPTVLINDNKTDRVFDVEGFRYSSYNCELRPASLEKDRAALVRAIEDTMQAHGKEKQIFSLVGFLGLKAAAVTEVKDSPESARLEIIDRKLNAIMSTIEDEKYFKSKRENGSMSRNYGIGITPNHNEDLLKLARTFLRTEPNVNVVESYSIEDVGDFIKVSDGSIIFSPEGNRQASMRFTSVSVLQKYLESIKIAAEIIKDGRLS